ncbi:maleylacetoacetate isomerase [Photobacterium sp.]|uniref:maleylacetoacetate isomerase n=1 Tax=Photobacterium sp. TaxID=660 RepID=UPI00299DE7E6|nr:maleylacetoacetate isomerase [Photobacterium sp.]MDX1301500.1 maleylacetoacetate isomerase [Photobacterium sp.]
MKLYDYSRSSASYRVRIAFNLKGLSYQQCPVSLLDSEQKSARYLSLNPNGLVPCLDTDQGVLGQSLAIIEYLEETYPEHALLPADPWLRAQCRSLAQLIACDIHPLNNLQVLNYLNSEFGTNKNEKMVWYHHWLARGCQALETIIVNNRTRDNASDLFCCGDSPTLADICLVPQLYNANRFGFDLSPYPTLVRIDHHCQQLDAFIQAHPDNQS